MPITPRSVSLTRHTDRHRSSRPARSRTTARPNAGRARERHSEALLRAAAAVLSKTAEDFLPAVVEEIAMALRADAAMVAELVTPDRLRTVALWQNGHLADNLDYALQDIEADGFVTLPLVDSKGARIGLIAAAARAPIDDAAHARSVLRLFAGRAAAEMQRAITERDLQKSQEHLFQVQRVEAIGRLAGNIAHDFNNLLMIVIGYAEILKSRQGPGPELTQLLGAADRATTLTRQLLAFGRRQVMEVQRLDMNRVVTQVQAMLARVIGAQVHLTTSLDPDLPSVEADPGQIEQVLVNLAINARDAMPEGGTLRIATAVEEVTEAYNQMPPGRYVTVVVSDTGTGMPPEVLQHIFEPFFTTKGSGGTGLGLSSVYGIIKQTGGFIWCQSQPGSGTTFRIYLRPATGAPDASPAPPDEPPTAPAGGTETILVVDDERGVRALLTQILRNRGYTVIPAADAKTALEVLDTQSIDLVISDIVMHGMSGTRLVEEVLARWPAIKLLLVSGYSQGVALQPDSSARKVPLLGKPFTPTRLEAIVRDILDGAEVKRHPVQPE
jgi:two-component system, cell cycle sensor histidine kinase and response regulator CckA